MSHDPTPAHEQLSPELPLGAQRRHTRRPPLDEVDTWELWQAWKRGDRRTVLPWAGLLAGFCLVLAGMYAFFFLSTTLTQDTIAQIGLTLALLVFLYVIWRRISPRRDFALAIVASIVAVSGAAFGLWLLASYLSGWNIWVGIAGTMLLGAAGLGISLPSLNALARRKGSAED